MDGLGFRFGNAIDGLAILIARIWLRGTPWTCSELYRWIRWKSSSRLKNDVGAEVVQGMGCLGRTQALAREGRSEWAGFDRTPGVSDGGFDDRSTVFVGGICEIGV